ncbi:phage baseplate protein [Blautia massiliensis (ex Durand et al. 2017)]|uniref:phage baseplate protein n=1 Tax=Blautia massiliensis (ex Durand et al. 2017) TaxID=1737424 RepID=UPI0035625708
MMLQNLNHPMCQEQTSGALDSPVRIFQSQESSGDWSEKEVEYILTLLTSSKAKKKVISPHTVHGSGVSGADATAPTSNAGSHTHSLTPKGTIASTGGGASHSNLQPYIVCYMWKRTA